MSDVLAGVGEFFREKGCYILHFLDDNVPHIKIKRHGIKGFVEGQLYNGKLRLLFRSHDDAPQYAYTQKGKKTNIRAARPVLAPGYGAREYELSHPDSLSHAFQYVRKHLFPLERKLRGGIGDSVCHQRVERPAPSPEAGQADS